MPHTRAHLAIAKTEEMAVTKAKTEEMAVTNPPARCAPILDLPRDPLVPLGAIAVAGDLANVEWQCMQCAPSIDVPHDGLAPFRAIAAASGTHRVTHRIESPCMICAPSIDLPHDPLAPLKAIAAAANLESSHGSRHCPIHPTGNCVRIGCGHPY
jgi:hypothetical protein